ncbi:hypothetical protein FRC06_005264, partial [Ceratobasidium sp. 370]
MSDQAPQQTQPTAGPTLAPVHEEALPFPPVIVPPAAPERATERPLSPPAPLLVVSIVKCWLQYLAHDSIAAQEQINQGVIQDSRKPKTGLPAKPDDVPADHDAEYLKGIGRGGRVWTKYVEETTEYDGELVDGWNRSLDVTLGGPIFSYFNCPDSSDRTVAILLDISQAIRGDLTGGSTTPPARSEVESNFHPTATAVWVNALWFLSLSLSVAVSLVTMLAKQWCYYFLYARTGDAITQAEQRQKRYDGLTKWRMQGILEQLPVLMHLSLALFSVGLVLYLWSINIVVATIVTGVSLGALSFYLGTTLVPVKVEFCPFKTPQAVYTRAAIDALFKYKPIVRTAISKFKNRPWRVFYVTKCWASMSVASVLGYQQNDPNGLDNMSSARLGVSHRLRTRLMAIKDSTLGFIRSHLDFARFLTLRTEHGAEQEQNVPVENTNGENQGQDQPEQRADEPDSDNKPAFVKDALTWLILNSQNSSSIDVAIGAVAVGDVKLQDEDLKNRINSHLIKHFSDCFYPTGAGVELQLQSPESSLPPVLDYVNWMTYFAGGDLQSIAVQVQRFNVSYGIEAVTHLGLALASLAGNKRLLPDIGRKGTLYLNEEVLPVMVDGLTVASLHYHSSSSKRDAQDSNRVRGNFQDLAIQHLTEILWKVSHVKNSPLRSSIGLNLAVFALKTNLYYPVDTKRFESAAHHLAYNYHSLTDRDDSFVPFIVFALLGILHPRSNLELDDEVATTMCSLIRETEYLDGPGLVMNVPHLGGLDPLGRCMTVMLVETMIQAQGPKIPQGIGLRLTTLTWGGFVRWSTREFP